MQTFQPLVKIFWSHDHEKSFCYQITFYMKLKRNKIVYLQQHFKETVKPGKNLL